MRIDKGRISGLQFMFLIACYYQASSLLTAFQTGVTKQDTWIMVLIGSILSLPFLWAVRTLMVTFPDKNLIQILSEVYGPVIGKILGLLYLWYFLTVASLNLMDLADFTKGTIMTRTPSPVMAAVCILVASIAVRRGIRLVAKYGPLFTIIAAFIFVLSTLLVVNQIKLEHYLPIFSLPPKKYLQGAHISTTIPFGEHITFLMIHPAALLSRRDTGKYLFLGFAVGALTLFITTLRDIGVLGNTVDLFTVPSLMTLRLVHVGPTISRTEILFSVIFMILLFFKITVLFYVTVLTVAQLFNIKSYQHLILTVGSLIVVYGITLYPNPQKHAASAQEVEPVIWTLFELFIPLLTSIVAKIRKLPKVKEA